MTDWKKIAEDSAKESNEKFAAKIAAIIRLNNSEIEEIISNTGISRTDLVSLIDEIKSAAISNEKKAENIQKISGGVKALIAIASKMI